MTFNVPKLVAINGKYVCTDAVALMQIQNPSNGISMQVLVIVSPNLKNDLLIGYLQLKKLKVISDDFPFLRLSTTSMHNFDKIEKSIFD